MPRPPFYGQPKLNDSASTFPAVLLTISMTPEQIEQLLHEEEGTALDFKRDQYKFVGATDDEKSEILKDILAFSNAFRRADAYIVLGVEEIRGGRSKVVGVSTHLDDASIQQFVNSKTQRPVTFSYREETHDDFAIGIIHIPIQTRPIHAKADFGKVRKEAVYLRRGSSTAIAKPDEIAQMGISDVDRVMSPSVELSLVNRETGKSLGNSATINKCTLYDLPGNNEIPDYRPGEGLRIGHVQFIRHNPLVNNDFLREYAAYVQTEAYFPIVLETRNIGGTVIQDTKLALELHDPGQNFEILRSQDCPTKPSPNSLMARPVLESIFEKHDVFITKQGDVWNIDCTFGKIQPGAKVCLQDDLLIGSRIAGEFGLIGVVFADNISNPIPVCIALSFQTGSSSLTVEEIKERARLFISEE